MNGRGPKISVETDQIRPVREEAGLTQTEAGELIHVHQRTWADYESGRKDMPLDKFELFLLKIKHPKICRTALEGIAMKI